MCTIKLYTLSGKLIRIFYGATAAVFDGRDQMGNLLASGICIKSLRDNFQSPQKPVKSGSRSLRSIREMKPVTTILLIINYFKYPSIIILKNVIKKAGFKRTYTYGKIMKKLLIVLFCSIQTSLRYSIPKTRFPVVVYLDDGRFKHCWFSRKPALYYLKSKHWAGDIQP